ncbi:FklB, partial [Escherichia coli]
MSVVLPLFLYSCGLSLLFLFPWDLSLIPRQSFTRRSVADILPATLYPKKGNTMTTPT